MPVLYTVVIDWCTVCFGITSTVVSLFYFFVKKDAKPKMLVCILLAGIHGSLCCAFALSHLFLGPFTLFWVFFFFGSVAISSCFSLYNSIIVQVCARDMTNLAKERNSCLKTSQIRNGSSWISAVYGASVFLLAVFGCTMTTGPLFVASSYLLFPLSMVLTLGSHYALRELEKKLVSSDRKYLAIRARLQKHERFLRVSSIFSSLVCLAIGILLITNTPYVFCMYTFQLFHPVSSIFFVVSNNSKTELKQTSVQKTSNSLVPRIN